MQKRVIDSGSSGDYEGVVDVWTNRGRIMEDKISGLAVQNSP